MRKILLLLITLSFVFILTSCGDSSEKEDVPETFEIAMISDAEDVTRDEFGNTTWTGIEAFCLEYERTCKFYGAPVKDGASEKEVNEACEKATEAAIKGGAKVIVFAGSQFETTVYAQQNRNKDICFLLIDGVPRDEEHNYELAANSTGVLFAEEEAGFLAGYAAIADGYNKLGFIGGKETPPVKRYAYGYMQGIAKAAEDLGIPGVELKYCYTDTFSEEDWITEGSTAWYKAGTQVIFACGGTMANSVIKAADYAGGKVIGVDTDMSGLSESVITSAKKEIKTAIYDILKTYIHDNFKGNSVFNYSLENKGIDLEMTNARFNKFGPADYNDLVIKIGEGDIRINKEMGNRDLEDLAPKTMKVTREKISTSDSQD